MADQSLIDNLKTHLTAEVMRDPSYPLGDDESLIDSGLIDSFSLVDVALWVEQNHGVRIADSELNADTFDTVTELAEYIEQHR